MAWCQLLTEALGRPDLIPCSEAVPFGVDANEEVTWHQPTLRRLEDSSWQLLAGSPQGLEVRWDVRTYRDTRAVECGGVLRNIGDRPFSGIRRLRTFDMEVGLAEGWGEPHVRTFNGVRFLASSFPPDDFRLVDRQLLRIPQAYTPYVISASDTGYSSGDNLPMLLLSGESSDRGLAVGCEWSGLWEIGVQQGGVPHGNMNWPWSLRLTAGIWGLEVDLGPGEELPLARVLVCGFDGDLEVGGNALRRHVRRHISPNLNGEPALPPVSYDTWFSFENQISESTLKPVAAACSQTNIEYFIVDGGWTPGEFRRGIGNWSEADRAKFPNGMAAFSSWLGEQGLMFGLHGELEVAHLESELYRAHPEWFLRGPHVSQWVKPFSIYEAFHDFDVSLGMPDSKWFGDLRGDRFALLDLGQPEARQWLLDRVVELYERWGVRWIRWDLNATPRAHWDLNAGPGRTGLAQIRYITGLYEVLDEILAACPELVLEQCASGGHRIDLGTARRGHLFWMNDQTSHTDLARVFQHRLNSVLPGIYANTNLCQERFDYDDYDFLSHGGGSMGLSGPLNVASRAELESLSSAIDRFKGYRHLLGGDYFRSTGEPDNRFDYAHVSWSDGSESVEMEFNAEGPRSANLSLSDGI